MGEALAKFGISGGVGFLFGLVAVWWVRPTTEGGTLLLVAICVIASAVIGAIVPALFHTRKSSKPTFLLRKDRVGSRGRRRSGAAEQPLTGAPPKIFISYSHADKKWLERLKRHLKPLVREGGLDCWDDTHIRAGDDWQEEIRTALGTAQAAVLLISADFFASDFIDESALPPLLTAAQDRGVRVLPLILSASRFARDPNLARFQAVNSPDRPLNEMPDGEQEKVLERLAQTIESTLKRF